MSGNNGQAAPNTTPDTESIFGPVIHRYTRAEAIADGVLVDVSETAREAGFSIPVAVTHRVWGEIVTPDERSRKWGQSERGRLWDVVMMLRFAIARRPGTTGELFYRLYAIMKEKQRRLVTLKALCGAGDDGEPVITIMFPQED